MNEPGDQSIPGSERRQAVRYACILAAVDVSGQLAFMPALMPGWPVRVLNISRSGVGIHAGDQLDEGTLLTIRLYDRTGKPSAPHQVRIIHATQQADGTWMAGAAFIEPIGDEELQLLLCGQGTDDNQ
jgi:hypothetical protein